MKTVDGAADQARADALSLDSMGQIMRLFSDTECLVERLEYVEHTLAEVVDSWASPSTPDADAILGVLTEVARTSVVPPGCEQVHDAVMEAMQSYREAAEWIQRAKLDAKPSEKERAWQRVREGNALVRRAIKMASVVQ